MEPEPIRLSSYNRVVVLTGAGVSAPSGLQTFRGPNGLWNDATLEALSHHSTFDSRPEEVWAFWGRRRSKLAAIEPNAIHEHLAFLGARCAAKT